MALTRTVPRLTGTPEPARADSPAANDTAPDDVPTACQEVRPRLPGEVRLASGEPEPGLRDAPAGLPEAPAFPEVGQEVLGFRLLAELGRGAFARVFLAQQADLAARRVVVKVSAAGDEPQTLAQLQHTNIVPIYSAHEDPQSGLRAVCMPYFGGASLAHVLQRLWSKNDRPCKAPS